MPDTRTAKSTPTSKRMQARIIDAVVEMVSLHGISGTTLANVAAAADVSQGVLVFHFRSKEGLLAGTLSRLLEEYAEAWRDAVAAPEPLDRLLGLVKADFGRTICTRRKLALWFSFWGEAAAKPLYNRLSSEAELQRFLAMKEACEALALQTPIADPVRLANSIDAHTDGLWLQMHLQGDAFPRESGLETALAHLRLLLPALASRIG